MPKITEEPSVDTARIPGFVVNGTVYGIFSGAGGTRSWWVKSSDNPMGWSDASGKRRRFRDKEEAIKALVKMFRSSNMTYRVATENEVSKLRSNSPEQYPLQNEERGPFERQVESAWLSLNRPALAVGDSFYVSKAVGVTRIYSGLSYHVERVTKSYHGISGEEDFLYDLSYGSNERTSVWASAIDSKIGRGIDLL